MPFCSICGRHIPESEGTTLCKECKENQAGSAYPLVLSPTKSKRTASALIILLSIVLGVGVFFVSFFR